MVSHFLVRTDICIPRSIVAEFNAWLGNLDVASCEDLVPEFFDRMWGDPETSLQRFIRANQAFRHLQDAVLYNGWAAKVDGTLYARLEPFHGAVSMMWYMIDTFFKPRDIILQGTIVGVNPAYGMVYVYTVEQNTIEFDTESTHAYMLEYESMRNDPDAPMRMLGKLRDELDLDFEL